MPKPKKPGKPMQLKVLLPSRVFAEKTSVLRIVAETHTGSFGILPHRLDCVAALAAGIFTYETEAEGEVFLAVDEGVLVKAGPQVLVSVRHAQGGSNLHQLRETVEQEFKRAMNKSNTHARYWPNWKPVFYAALRLFNMNKPPAQKPGKHRKTFTTQIEAKVRRKIRARGNTTPGVWSGLGMIGLIGWSVAVPTLLGAALGLWLDDQYASSHSWTLALLIAGLTVGCLNAWNWVAKEDKAMQPEHATEEHPDD